MSPASFCGEFFGFLFFIEIVVARQRFLNSKMVEKFDGLSRVFTRDKIDLLENFQRAVPDIAEISDRAWRRRRAFPSKFKGLTENVGQLKYFFVI